MLRGNYPATVDGKGRLKIPAEFKVYLEQAYGPEFYVTSLNGDYARIYPFAVWHGIEEKLAALPSMDKSKQKFLDRTSYFGKTVSLDAQGRLLVPTVLREKAAIQGVVAVMGRLTYLDVWNDERFREQRIDGDPLDDGDFAKLSSLGI